MIDLQTASTEYLLAYAAHGRGEISAGDYAVARFKFRCARSIYAAENGAPLFAAQPLEQPAEIVDLAERRKARRG